MKEECRAIIKVLTNKDYVLFTSRGNESIRLAMLAVAHHDRHTVLFQDEGGWLTYEKYIKQANLEPIRLVTDDGLISFTDLVYTNTNTALLLNSLAGYVAPHNMDAIHTSCFQHDVFLVNDVSGSIGTLGARQGEIILGSFGKAKPVNLGAGGFIATADEDLFNFIKETADEEFELDWVELEKKLRGIRNRREFLINRCNKIKKDLSNMDIVHKAAEGLNVIIRFKNQDEKSIIINYCNDNKLEYTICPREIRIKDDAVSIEVKRLLN